MIYILVAMPGIEWKQDCVAESGGQQNMNCMKWNEDKERVVNVICLLKCEAKKMAAAGEAAASLREIRVSVKFILHYIKLHYITLHYVTLRYITLHYV